MKVQSFLKPYLPYTKRCNALKMIKSGLNLELLVQIFEKSLDPSARVEHDVQMPVITSQIGATRQCDIVITQGNPPRQTISIVEVQDRNKKPSRNDLGGWIDKMKEVGAQHLICVSKIGFTTSQKEKASQVGNSIRLIELKEIGDSAIPLKLDLQFAHCVFKVTDLEFRNVRFSSLKSNGEKEEQKDIKKVRMSFEGNTPFGTYDKRNYYTMSQLINNEFKDYEENSNGVGSLKFPIRPDLPLYIPFENDFLIIEFEVSFNWEHTVYNLPINTLSYEQNDFGTLGWVAEFIYNENNKTTSYKLPFEPNNNGGYRMKTMSIDEFENGKLVKREILK